jgi:hypothetical protein
VKFVLHFEAKATGEKVNRLLDHAYNLLERVFPEDQRIGIGFVQRAELLPGIRRCDWSTKSVKALEPATSRLD